MTFQEIIETLNRYWAAQGCLIQQPYDIEVGAGTFNPATSLRTLGPEPYRVAYVEPSRRPTDGRYGENPYRLGHYYQYQVILKPAPENSQELYLGSLEALGLDPRKNDFRFVEDDWESPTLGASGLGWEVWCNGAEVTQYTYFQQMGSIETNPISVELTYGLERLAMYLQGVSSLFDVQWNDELTYGDVHHQTEVEYSRYYLEHSTTERLFRWFDEYEQECLHCVSKGLVFPGLDYVLKASHTFNMLDARGAISVAERVGYIARVRNLARRVARAYVAQREALGYPLLHRWKTDHVESQPPLRPASEPKTARADVLFEIGCEEIPADYIEPALEQMRQKTIAWLDEQRLAYESVRTLATPRRLTLAIRNVSTRQDDQMIEVPGPPARVAYDAEGRPTRAAEGFARQQGVPLDALFIQTTEKGPYVFARRVVPGRLTGDLLAEFLPRLVTELRFPKTMRWENSRFARPIRWLVALLGDEVIDFAFDRLRSGRTTRGHRFLGKSAIPLESANLDDYIALLRENAVVVDPAERKARIREAVERETTRMGGQPRVDEDLLQQVTYLVEYPQAVVGAFSEAHLAVPAEVLATSMKKHQRYFPVYNADGSLQAKFIAISNGTEGGEENVRYGNERVLRARLEDAAFFWAEDQREPFGNRIERLKRVMFQERLGTLFDKTERVKRLAVAIASAFGCEEAKAARAAELSKADLTTWMVYEFPELQGVMGRYYAANSGEPEDVARAIEEHYLPTSAESPLPKTPLGAVISIADKMDTLVGYFGIGLTPTGSQDPFSLRRQAIGVCRILLGASARLSLGATIERAVAAYGELVAPDTAERVRAFFRARLEVILSERGYAHDDIDAVLSAGFDVLADVPSRLDALRDFRRSEDFQRVYPAFNRLLRILPPGEFQSLGEELMRERAEVNLRSVVKMLRPSLDTCVIQRDYAGLLRVLSTLQPNIDAFFDEVLVMEDDLAIRTNRLALLKSIADYILTIADFSKLVIPGS